MKDAVDRLKQKLSSEQQQVEAGHQVAHAEDADPGGASDEDDGENEPEQVAEDDDLQHVQIRPGRGGRHKTLPLWCHVLINLQCRKSGAELTCSV